MNITKVPLTLSLAVLAFTATPAFAGPGAGAGARHEMRARISDAVTTRLATAIGLDAAATANLHAIVAKWAPQLEAQEQQIAQARRQLRQLVAARSNDATAFKQATDAFLAARAQHQALQDSRHKEVRAALTPLQFGMAVLETPRIEKQVMKEMLSAAGHNAEEE